MRTLADLTAEMRALGIRSLAIELDGPTTPTYTPSDTEIPAPAEQEPTEPDKPTTQCSVPGCYAPREGIFGAALDLCATHALGAAGVK